VGSKTKFTDAADEMKKYVSSMLLDIFEGKKSATSIADRFLKFARGKASLGINSTRDTREPSVVFTNIILPIILTPSEIDLRYYNTTFNKVMLSKFLPANVTNISVLQGAILKGNTELVRIIMDTANNWGANNTVDINKALTTNIGTIDYTSAKDLIYTSGLGTSPITVQKEVPVPSVDVLNEMGKILYGDFPDKVVGNVNITTNPQLNILQKYNTISAFRNKEMGLNSYINLVKNTGDDTIDTATYSIIFQYTQPPPYIEKLNTLLDAFTAQSTKSHTIDSAIAEVDFGKIDDDNVNNYFIGNINRIKDASAMVSAQKAKMEDLNPGAATQVETLTQKGIELKNNIENAYQSIIDFLQNVLKHIQRVNIQAAIDNLNETISQSKDQANDRNREELTTKINALKSSDTGAVELEQLQAELANLPHATNVLEQQTQDLKKDLDKLDVPTTGPTQEYSAFIQAVGYDVVYVINQLITYINAKKIDPNTQDNPKHDTVLQTSLTIAQALQTVAKNKAAITQNKTAIDTQTDKEANRGKFQELSQLYVLTVSTLSEYMTLVEEFDKTPQMTALIKNTRQDSNITPPSSQKGLPGPGPGTGTGTAPGSSKENPLVIKPDTAFFIIMEGKTYQITPGKSTVPADAATVPASSFNGTRYDA
tara:strand:+ start:77 stop:2038 length:1962 start_codon:yes stop_codon:yes gene_type:complete